jgi:PAS domain S-box-containing protein
MEIPSVSAHLFDNEAAVLPTHIQAVALLTSVLTPGVLQEAIDSLTQGVVCFDSDHQLICFNRRYAELLELPAEFLQRQPSKHEIVAFQRQRRDFDPPGRFFDTSGQTVQPDPVTDEMPEHYWRSVRSGKTLEVTVSRLSSGLFVRTFSDVSAYFKAQREAQKNASRLQRILDATNPGTWETYLSTGRVEINDAWARMFGYELNELQPMSRERWRAMIHPEDLVHTQVASFAFLTGTSKQFDSRFRMCHKAGHWVWVRCTGKNYDGVLEDGSIVISGTLFDISEKVAAQQQSTKLTEQLKEEVDVQHNQLDRAVRDMAHISAGLAHDLRTPLRSINGLASILGEGVTAANPKLVSLYAEKITELSGRMGRMISAMLEMLQVLQRPTSLKPVIVSVMAKEKMEGLRVGSNVDFDCAETPLVNADPDLLGRVLEELLRNAVAYTKESSSPRVEVGYVSEDQVYFVRDNGVGFDMAKADQLFKPFTRLHQVEPSDGLGMGLAIASRCVERMGGRLWASSSPGTGSTFFFSLGKDSDF